MHIPDGYLSPQTYVPLSGVFVAVAAVAVKKVKKEISAKSIPYLGMASAFSFLIMMFNLPIPGGTTGHAVGLGNNCYYSWTVGFGDSGVGGADNPGIDFQRRRYYRNWRQLR